MQRGVSSTLQLAAFLAVFVSPALALPACDPSTEPDKSDVENARAAVAANCDCSGGTRHRDYVACAASAAKAVLVNQGCAGYVKKCASHSTCGKPGFVTCCRTTGKSVTTCSIKGDATKCRPPKGGSECVGQAVSCCDACTPSGCATTTTTSSTTLHGTTSCPSTSTTTTLPLCDPAFPACAFNGICFNGHTCEVDTSSGQCACTGPPPTCGQWGTVACGGTCPTGSTCLLENVAPPSCPQVEVCHCVEGGTTTTTSTSEPCPTTTTLGMPPCGGIPGCGGQCPDSQTCGDDGTGHCACLGTFHCGGAANFCGGDCPIGQSCQQLPVPAGCPSIGCGCQ